MPLTQRHVPQSRDGADENVEPRSWFHTLMMVLIIVTRWHQSISIHFNSSATYDMYLCVYLGKGMMPVGRGKHAKGSFLLTRAVGVDLTWKCESRWALDGVWMLASFFPTWTWATYFSELQFTRLENDGAKVAVLVCSGCLNEYLRLGDSNKRNVFLTAQQTRRPRSGCPLIHFPCEDSLPACIVDSQPLMVSPQSRERESKLSGFSRSQPHHAGLTFMTSSRLITPKGLISTCHLLVGWDFSIWNWASSP